MFSNLEISKKKDFKEHLNRYDVIHLGYLAYNQKSQSTYIPNEEIRQELASAVETKKWNDLISFHKI